MERRGNSFLCSSNGAAGAGPGRVVSAGPTTARPYWKTRWCRERGHLHALLLPRDPLVPPELRAAGPARFCLLSPWSAGGCGRAVTNHGGPHAVPFVPARTAGGKHQDPGGCGRPVAIGVIWGLLGTLLCARKSCTISKQRMGGSRKSSVES